MSTPVSTGTEPMIPGGEAFYDALMAVIEPELMTAQLPIVESLYAADTPEERVVRKARYDAAFEEFSRRSAEEIARLEQDVHTYCKNGLKEIERANRQEESVEMSALESTILAA